MKRVAFIFGPFILAIGIAFTGFTIRAQDTAQHLREKAAQAQAGVRSWVEAGRDPSAVIAVMQQVKPALDAGQLSSAGATHCFDHTGSRIASLDTVVRSC